MNPFILLLALFSGQSDTLAALDYHSDGDARAAWTANEGTPPVLAYDGAAGRALRVDAPLATNTQLRRAVIDRDVKLNLAVPTSFTLDVNASHPDVMDHVTLYFHSVDGWFAAGARLQDTGWQTLRFDKAVFGREDAPAGWHEIDRIRIAAWRSNSDDVKPRDAMILMRDLTATWNNTAIILPASDKDESRASRDAADTLEEMLGELGVNVDRLTESSILEGAPGKRRLVLLPYNRPDDHVCDVLKKFVDGGGKLFLGYAVPDQLQEAVGFRGGTYYRPAADEPKLATIRFDAGDLAGLPAAIDQASWNISTVEPAGHGGA